VHSSKLSILAIHHPCTSSERAGWLFSPSIMLNLQQPMEGVQFTPCVWGSLRIWRSKLAIPGLKGRGSDQTGVLNDNHWQAFVETVERRMPDNWYRAQEEGFPCPVGVKALPCPS
jgi:hypothetical protein